MSTEVKLPRLGQGMESGTIVRWLKREGDTIARGEPLYELDTDKVTQEVEAEVDGVLLQILVESGEVEVGATIAVVGTDGDGPAVEPVTAPEPSDETAPVTPAPAPPVADEDGTPTAAAAGASGAPDSPDDHATPPASASGRVKASPLARRIARERGVDLASVVGTGPEGRVLADDVERAAAGEPAPASPAVVVAAVPSGELEVVQLTNVRKTIARRLTEAWTAPVFQLQVDADAFRLLGLRGKLVDGLREGEVKPTVNDVLTRLVATTLRRHPALNAIFTGEEIHRYPDAHVGIAIAAPTGLVVPVIRSADRLSVQEIAVARADLVARAREGKLTLPDLEGGTFTISNLGMFGIDRFTAVLNPPQVAILAVGAAVERPVVHGGEIRVTPVLTLTLTCDHRAIDGAEGAEFLQTLKALVEHPGLAL
jgi:pyruvate dehydrogenase E2 component (dihydrolipoamide acetyltransferase)